MVNAVHASIKAAAVGGIFFFLFNYTIEALQNGLAYRVNFARKRNLEGRLKSCVWKLPKRL